MYEHYLAKSTAKAQQEETDNNEGEAATGQGNRRRRSRQMRPGARVVLEQLQLTSQQKCDVAASSLGNNQATICLLTVFFLTDELKFKLDKERSVYDDQLCDIQAAIEEEDMREQELRMLHFDFQREIVEGAVSRANGKVLGEAVEHYFESRQKARAMLIEQLQLKDGRLKVDHALWMFVSDHPRCPVPRLRSRCASAKRSEKFYTRLISVSSKSKILR